MLQYIVFARRMLAARLLPVFSSVIVFVVFVASPVIANAYSWLPYAGHWYALTEVGTWAAEEAEAITAGGHLITINNASENEWLAATFNGVYPEAVNIGYYFNSSTSDWRWASGESVTYTNLWESWGSYTGNFAYLHTNNHPIATARGSWNHASWVTDVAEIGGVIERTTDPTNPVPEPVTMLLLGLGLMGIAGIRRRLS